MNLKALFFLVGWSMLLMDLGMRDLCWGRMWIWVGRLGISFHRIPRFSTKLMVKKGALWGIRVSQFGPLVVTWKERATMGPAVP